MAKHKLPLPTAMSIPALSNCWSPPGENPPIGPIICTDKGAAEARYAIDKLPNKGLAAEHQTVIPDNKLISEELVRSRRELEVRSLAKPTMESVA